VSPKERGETVGPAVWSVLVADEDPELCRLIEDVVRDAGHEVRSTASSAEAQALLAAGGIDLLIIGDGLSTSRDLGFVRRVRAHARVPTIVMTAFGHAAPGAGAGDEFLSKPFRAADLAARIERIVLARQRAAG
jgi:DNA-binding response OmpR family regulator